MNAFAYSTCIVASMDAQRDVKEWIRQVCAFLGTTPSALARQAGVAPSTLTRFLNDETGTSGVSQRTLEALSRASGVPVLQMPLKRGETSADAVPFEREHGIDLPMLLSAALAGATKDRSDREVWLMRSRALDMSAVWPGDILVIDPRTRAKQGDMVLAEIIDRRAGRTESVIRVYEPPFLVTRSSLPSMARPLMVDDETIKLRGVVELVLRSGR